jgi:2-polyprenyl-3-methyl-5-hydroxy-6-metoxy-1,4-benzoquinol methylase
MKRLAKTLFRELCPPIVARGLRYVIYRRRYGTKESEWFDQMYKLTGDYHLHYTRSRYYWLWNVISDRIIRASVKRVLDLGCGLGQFASLLYDKGIEQYSGIDFSAQAVDMAKQGCPSFEFKLADIVNSDILEREDYDCVVALEFLEHIECDKEVMNRLRPGTKFFGTVPNFPDPSHVRHFLVDTDVILRYQECFSELEVDTFLQDDKEEIVYFLIEGRIG